MWQLHLPNYSFFLSRVVLSNMITSCHMRIFDVFKLTKMKGNEKFSLLMTLVTSPVLNQ